MVRDLQVVDGEAGGLVIRYGQGRGHRHEEHVWDGQEERNHCTWILSFYCKFYNQVMGYKVCLLPTLEQFKPTDPCSTHILGISGPVPGLLGDASNSPFMKVRWTPVIRFQETRYGSLCS